MATEIKDLLSEFYRLADLQDPNSGETMSEHVFAHDAVISMPNVTFTGKEGTYIVEASREISPDPKPQWHGLVRQSLC